MSAMNFLQDVDLTHISKIIGEKYCKNKVNVQKKLSPGNVSGSTNSNSLPWKLDNTLKTELNQFLLYDNSQCDSSMLNCDQDRFRSGLNDAFSQIGINNVNFKELNRRIESFTESKEREHKREHRRKHRRNSHSSEHKKVESFTESKEERSKERKHRKEHRRKHRRNSHSSEHKKVESFTGSKEERSASFSGADVLAKDWEVVL